MRHLDAGQVAAALPYDRLIEALRVAFRDGATVPLRSHHTIPTGGTDATLLLMPAWKEGGAVGVKIVTVYPDNGARALPAIHGLYLLLDGATGVPTALLDAPTLTARRTAAASALAASYLAKADASHLLVVGTGVIAEQLAYAHAAVRPIARISVWGRAPEKATALAARLTGAGLPAEPVADLQTAAAQADIVSCATLSATPLIVGDWLAPGAHLDLVGGFTPQMREADDTAVRRAHLFVDTREGALKEAGDIVDPLKRGVVGEDRIEADLYDLCRERHAGRPSADAVTLFKSVGTAIEDLAAAQLALSA